MDQFDIKIMSKEMIEEVNQFLNLSNRVDFDSMIAFNGIVALMILVGSNESDLRIMNEIITHLERDDNEKDKYFQKE